jgi:hypothetical protein
MAGLGLSGAKCGFGFDLYLAKIGISSPERAMEYLYESSVEISRRYKAISELNEGVRRRVLEIMCTFICKVSQAFFTRLDLGKSYTHEHLRLVRFKV